MAFGVYNLDVEPAMNRFLKLRSSRETSRVNGHVNGTISRSPPVSHSGDSIGSSESLLDRSSPATSLSSHTMNGQGLLLGATARTNGGENNGIIAWPSLDSSINSGSNNNITNTTNNNNIDFTDKNNSFNKSFTSNYKFQPSSTTTYSSNRSSSNGSLTAMVASPPSSSPPPPPPLPPPLFTSQSGINVNNSGLTFSKDTPLRPNDTAAITIAVGYSFCLNSRCEHVIKTVQS
ncbi:hypothetical protein RRG08_061013 [Elysia crispata]|uniref:Uncharacterized protein n=1 Tax=Elysia crispata TaxID=231223 RepID=A0AAE1AUW1_9GAST|nr:hypothetical protein RRG08_061013 [Elysia crispata]